MLNKIISYLIIFLVILLPFVNSHFFDLLGFKFGFYVDGNYEFTKVIFFNILTPIILSLFFIKQLIQENKIIIPKITIFLSFILILSTLFSEYILTSIFGTSGKGQGILMFLNLIGLFILFINFDKKELKKILKSIIISSALVIIIGLKEYYFPTFDYGNLSNRAIGTFGHPNYLALYLLILAPFIVNGIKNIKNQLLLIFLIILLILTKSVWGIFVFIIYSIFIIYKKYNSKISRKSLYYIGIISLLILGIIIYKFGLITKLNSFVSRFYIWETIINIIFSDTKNILLGVGTDTLSYLFDSHKSAELYIFENIGYTADRPHNLFLNVFYSFGIMGLALIIILLYKLIKQYEDNPYNHAIFIFIIFTFFNFPSISHYLIITLIGSIIYLKNSSNNYHSNQKSVIHIIPYILIGIIGIYSSINYYYEEYQVNLDKGYYSENKYYNILVLENPETKALKDRHSVEEACKYLIESTKSVENYFYCGNLYWDFNKKAALSHYNKGLDLLPDMWNKDSQYYNNNLVKKLFVPGRFYSEKFSNLEEILKRVGER